MTICWRDLMLSVCLGSLSYQYFLHSGSPFRCAENLFLLTPTSSPLRMTELPTSNIQLACWLRIPLPLTAMQIRCVAVMEKTEEAQWTLRHHCQFLRLEQNTLQKKRLASRVRLWWTNRVASEFRSCQSSWCCTTQWWSRNTESYQSYWWTKRAQIGALSFFHWITVSAQWGMCWPWFSSSGVRTIGWWEANFSSSCHSWGWGVGTRIDRWTKSSREQERWGWGTINTGCKLTTKGLRQRLISWPTPTEGPFK